jgi:aspartate racemase
MYNILDIYRSALEIKVQGKTELIIPEITGYSDLQAVADETGILIHCQGGAKYAPSEKKYRTIGILGGLGPYATADIFEKIIRNTPAAMDQEHIKIVIINNPQIPDRTMALRGKGITPAVAMLAGIEGLERAKADFVIIPCNTAHAFVNELKPYIKIPILSMIEETVQYVIANHPDCKNIGLLATTGTVESGVYAEYCEKAGLNLLTPSRTTQENLVMRAIYGPSGIKAGNQSELPAQMLNEAAAGLIKAGAGVVILGCTEIPLVIGESDLPVPAIDPTEILAKAAVKMAMVR